MRIARMTRITAHHSSDGDSETRLPHARLTRDLIGAFYDVYNELGYGFLERNAVNGQRR